MTCVRLVPTLPSSTISDSIPEVEEQCIRATLRKILVNLAQAALSTKAFRPHRNATNRLQRTQEIVGRRGIYHPGILHTERGSLSTQRQINLRCEYRYDHPLHLQPGKELDQASELQAQRIRLEEISAFWKLWRALKQDQRLSDRAICVRY